MRLKQVGIMFPLFLYFRGSAELPFACHEIFQLREIVKWIRALLYF